MSIIRSGNSRQCLKSIHAINVRKVQGMDIGFRYLISPSQLRIHGCSMYPCLSVHNARYQEPVAPIFVQDKALYRSPAYHLATRHHRSASSYSGTVQPGLPVNTSTNKNFNSHDYFNEKSNRHSRTREKIHSNLVKCLSHLLAGLGLSYIIYKVGAHIHEQSDILPVANCSSQEPQATQLEGQTTQMFHSSSKKSLKKSEKGKTPMSKSGTDRISLHAAVERAQKLCQRRREEVGSPGIVVCVSVDGKQVYAEGFGYSDVENEIPIKPSSVLRIASISKAMTATIVARAWEEGRIDIDKSVQHYVPSFPQKEFMGEKVEVTVQQLLNHTSGIRHYKAKNDPVYAFDKPIANLVGLVKNASWQPFYKTAPARDDKTSSKGSKAEKEVEKKKSTKAEVSDLERDEYYLTKHFSTTAESLALFANDQLLARPGTKYIYTTFAYTLLAAVVEAALKSPFTDVVTKTLGQMGLTETYLDLNEPVIYNRAQYYVKDVKGQVVNAPYVDNSYKWAGGGLLSTSEDMVKFGNILLYSAQHKDGDPGPRGFLKSSTMWKFWSSHGTNKGMSTYGLGFQLRPASELFGMCDYRSFGAGHTGAAIGVSSALFILPRLSTPGMYETIKNSNSQGNTSKVSRDKSAFPAVKKITDPVKFNSEPKSSSSNIIEDASCVPEKNLCQQISQSVAGQLPQGVVVCIILNMISVSARDIAEDIARTFEKVDFTL